MKYVVPVIHAVLSFTLCGIALSADQTGKPQVRSDKWVAESYGAFQQVKSNQANQPQESPARIATPAANQIPAKDDKSEADQLNQNLEIQRKLVTATRWLVGVGVLQALVLLVQATALFWTLRAIKRQVDITAKIERPWILASIEQTIHTESIGDRPVLLHRCTIKNVGKTPAWIIAWTSKTKDVEIDVLDPEPNYGDMKGSISQVLPPGDSLSSVLGWLPERFDQAHRDKLFLYVFGFVSYKDGFGDPHETRFCFRYYPPFRDNKAQGFHVAGPPAYNLQT